MVWHHGEMWDRPAVRGFQPLQRRLHQVTELGLHEWREAVAGIEVLFASEEDAPLQVRELRGMGFHRAEGSMNLGEALASFGGEGVRAADRDEV